MARIGRTPQRRRAAASALAALSMVAALAAVVSAAAPTWQFGPAGGDPGELGSHAADVAVGPDGRLYVTDTAQGEIDVYAQGGTHLAAWGGFESPSAVAVDGGGQVFVADHDGVHRLGPDGVPAELVSAVADATGLAIGLGGSLVIAAGDEVLVEGRVIGGIGALDGVAVGAGGDIFVAAGSRIHRYSWEGEPETSWFVGHARDVDVGPDGSVHVAEGNDHRVGVYDADGAPLRAYDEGMNVVAGVAVDCRGATYAVDNSDPRGHAFTSPGTPPPPCLPAVEVLPEVEEPLPQLGRTGRASVVDGKVFVGKGASRRELRSRRLFDVGTSIDTSEGTVKLEFETKPGEDRQTYGRFMEGTFSDGVFTPHQGREDSIVELYLEGSGVGAATSKAQASQRRKRRRVWSTARGRFRTSGRHGAATVRGTRWFTEDRPNGTFFRVTEGSVLVREFVSGKKILLNAGDSYLAQSCSSRRRFWIRLRIPVGAEVQEVAVRLRGERVPIRRGRRIRALIDMRGFPQGHFTARIKVSLANGLTLTGTRVYETCAEREPRGEPPAL